MKFSVSYRPIAMAVFITACFVAGDVSRADFLNLSSDGRLGPSSNFFRGPTQGLPYTYRFNTDDGKIWRRWTVPGDSWRTIDQSAKRVIAQADGPEVMLFEFTTFELASNFGSLTVEGSRAAAILATENMVIAGPVNVIAGRQPGAAGGTEEHLDGYDAPGLGGAYGGEGTDHGYHTDSHGNIVNAASGGGGGGGMVVQGEGGHPGNAVDDYVWDGHEYVFSETVQYQGGAGGLAHAFGPVLRGGGGGGGGGFYRCREWGFPYPGGPGSRGGGAVLFDTPADLTIEATGSIVANGEAGGTGGGGDGGGGSGGCIVFEVGNTWTNWGTIRAVGALGGHEGSEPWGDGGAGAGGRIVVDPNAIYNHGLIDVSSGNGDTTYGGLVEWDAPVIVNDGTIIGQVPEPNSLILLLLAGLMLPFLRRQYGRMRCPH